MKNELALREWATPLTMGAFALSAITGIMLFFKMQLGLIKPVHEWLSWLLVIGSVFHLVANRHVLVKYVSRPLGKGILIFFLVLICVSVVPFGSQQREHPLKRISTSLTQAPLSAVARIANHKPDEAANILSSNGINIESADQTIQDIAMQNGKNPLRILDVIF